MTLQSSQWCSASVQAKHVQQPKVVMKRIVLMSAPQMMTVNMIGYVVVMDVEDTLVLTLLKCVDQVISVSILVLTILCTIECFL